MGERGGGNEREEERKGKRGREREEGKEYEKKRFLPCIM